MLTTANRISIARVVLIPVYMLFALLGFPWSRWAAIAVFAIAGASDWVDGYIARKYNQVTTFGKFLDPLADKLLVASALLIFVQQGVMGAVPAFIMIARELMITSLRIVAMGSGIVIAAQKSGKLKTGIQIGGIIFLMIPELSGFPIAGFTAGNVVVWIMVLITVISGIEYFKNFGSILKTKKDK